MNYYYWLKKSTLFFVQIHTIHIHILFVTMSDTNLMYKYCNQKRIGTPMFKELYYF